jgi:alcohol dehydrogenase (nicotinoprotein)
MSMTTRAAVCRVPGQPWEITDLELDEPKANEVRIKFYASGLCHSDDHIQKGDARMRFPVVGGHEGAGVVDAVGPGVTRVATGDHLVCSFIPACGSCRYCSTGRQNLCDAGKNAATGEFPDGTFRFHQGGEDFGGLCVLGTFSQYAVVSEFSCIPIPDDIALFGDCNPLYDIPRLLDLYRSGDLKLDELISRRYRLDQVNEAYRDLAEGKNIRGVIVHEHG